MSHVRGNRVVLWVSLIGLCACKNAPADVPDGGAGGDAGLCLTDACGGDGGGRDSGGRTGPRWLDRTPTDPYMGPVVGRVAGRIRDMAGDPLPGVVVSLDSGATAVSDADGIYAIDDVTAGSYIAHFTAAGYLSIHRNATVDGWERSQVNAVLKEASPPQPFDSSAGATLRTGDVFVTVPPGAFVDGSGAAVAGMAEVSITPVDPTTADLEAAPGDYTGDDGGSMSPLLSYGMAEVTFSQGGSELRLAPGQTARVEIPVPALGPAMPAVSLGDSMPLWWFDPARASWMRDGTATAGRSADGSGRMVFTADVTHFTPWNCDRPAVPTCVQGQVVDCAGYPVAGAEIVMTGPGVTSLTRARTDSDGRYSVSGAARGEVVVEVRVSAGAQTFVAQSGPIATASGGCVSAPELAVDDIRYVGGMIEVWNNDFHSLDGAVDTSYSDAAANAMFWDMDDPQVPTFVSCAPPTPGDVLVDLPVPPPGMVAEVHAQDVGNPIVLQKDDLVIPIYRRNAEVPTANLVNTYTTLSEMGMAGVDMGGRVFDVAIPGAAESVPFTEHAAALRMPETLVVAVPPAEMRTYNASSGFPVRWDSSGTGGVVTIAVTPMGAGSVLYGTVDDDGQFDLTGPMLDSVGDAAMVVVSRSIEEFEPLPTGPSVMLRGTTSVSFDIRRE